MPESALGRLSDTARQLSINTSPQIFTDTVSSLETNDLYSFNLKGRSSFNLAIDDLSADADVKLFRDKNANGQFDKNEIVAYSNNAGKLAESISIELAAGTYYIEVYPYGNIQTDYRLSVSAVPFDSAGNTFNDARRVAVDSQEKTISDWVGKLDSKDYYKIKLGSTSDLNIVVGGLSADADLHLLSSQGNILASSVNIGTLNEAISKTLAAGTYYIEVNSYNNSETFYNLNVSASPVQIIPKSNTQPIPTSALEVAVSSAIPTNAIPETINIFNQAGTLRADTFNFQSGYNRTVFSGNGNVDYGSGARDLLNLSEFVSSAVVFNYANSPNGGVVYNLGNGNRIFDAITLSDGREILFEGIEAIKFADTTINLSVTPNDPLFNQQWNLQAMGVHNAWRFTTGADNVMIGIQDTGLGTDSNGNIHPDLNATSFIGNNYLDEWGNFSHGTLVQGSIAAVSNNGIGGAGINWNSTIISVDVVGGDALDENLATATQAMINQAKAQGKSLIINISLAGGYSTEFEQLIASNQNTVLFVIAAGNQDGNTIASPADLAQKYGNVVAVGSSWGNKDYYGNTRTPGERISYANWWGSNQGNGLTVTAPSEFVTTSANRNATGTFDFSYNNNFNGTSASTANVSGVASLIWSVNSNLSAAQVKAIIAETAYDLGNPGYDTAYGHGFINADAAVRRAIAIETA